MLCYNYEMKKIDFLAVGDVVVDAFIKLVDAHVHCKIDTDSCELCLRFGDKVPYEEVNVIPAVGNSPNAAVSASRLGLRSALITNVGNDQNGRECLESLKKDKVETKFITTEKNKKTNYHYVLSYDVDRTILIKHEKYSYNFPKPFLGMPEVSWMYLSSIGEDSLDYHKQILEFLNSHPETKLAFQPGTFQIKMGRDLLKGIYARTEIFFCNLEEAEKILGVQTKDARKLSEGIHALGPKMVSISDGPNGAYLYFNNELWQIPIYPDIAPPKERTGAGDAYSSTFVSALALGKSPVEALTWGPINSMSVVQEIGAQKGLLTREALESYLSSAPASYKANKIS